MSDKEWRGINDFYFVKGKKKSEPEPEDIEDPQEEHPEEKPVVEVRLSDPQFIKPEDGYQPNKPCKMQVSAEFLEETARKRVIFDVYSSYKGKEVLEYSGLEGFIKDGIAIAEMKYLPLNEDYAHDYDKAEDATYEVRFVAYHTTGEKPVESDLLQLPEAGGFKTVIEIEDVLFNLNSAVMLPDIPESKTSKQGSENDEGLVISHLQARATGLNAIRGIYKFIEENPEKFFVIAGHTDTSGEVEQNFELSEQRANNVLHLLLGDGDSWAKVCADKHRIEDYQQILKHYAGLLLWPCDPGEIDNKIGPKTKAAVKAFQQIYNANREEMGFGGGDIPIKEPSSNDLNVDTWKAFYNLYIWETAIITLGKQDVSKLSQLRENISFIDDNNKVIACGESFPIDKKAKDNYKSQKNRRVELLFFDPDEAPETVEYPESRSETYTKEDVPLYDDSKYKVKYYKLHSVQFMPFLDIQTVDSFGFPVPNTELAIISDNSGIEQPFSADVTTDDSAFVRSYGVPVGNITIKDREGTILTVFSKGKEIEAVFEARASQKGILSVIVEHVSQEEAVERNKHLEIYGNVSSDTGFLKSISPREKRIYELFNIDEDHRFLCKSTDNLLMAAGFREDGSPDIEKYVKDVLSKWLDDFFPFINAKDFLLYNIYYGDECYELSLYNSDGKMLGTFKLNNNLLGHIGTYTTLFMSLDGHSFLDVSSNKYKITDETLTSFELIDVVDNSHIDEYIEIENANTSKTRICNYMPGNLYFAVNTLIGGTGYLEQYSRDKNNSNIHERNVNVVKCHSTVYSSYIQNYISKVKACTDEHELKKLGPPIKGYQYPIPVNATQQHISDLASANNTSQQEYDAWVAINSKINEFIGRRSTGLYCVAKISYAQDINKIQKVQFEYNFTLDSDGKTLKKVDKKLLAGYTGEIDLSKIKKLPSQKTIEAGVEHELDLETGEGKLKGTLKVGKYGMEITNDGCLKLTKSFGERIEVLGETNPNEMTMGGGIEFTLNKDDPNRKDASSKVFLGVYCQALRPDTVMAFVSNAPGYFELRALSELLSPQIKWNDLSYREELNLEHLGFTMEFWDDKHDHSLADFPDSANKNYNDLSPREKVAVVHLGFNSTTWPREIKKIAKSGV